MSDRLVLEWSAAAAATPVGLAVVSAAGVFVQLNQAAVALCGDSEAALVGTPAPFAVTANRCLTHGSLFADETAEQVALWPSAEGPRREFAYRVTPLPDRPELSLVTFQDVTEERHRQRRAAALARSAATLASRGSLTATLDELAREVVQADALTGAQILTAGESGADLQIMGSAGFPRWPDFFARLEECRERGATLQMLQAYHHDEPVVIPYRARSLLADSAWEPLHAYLAELPWDGFASVPLRGPGHVPGILNAFFAPGQTVDARALEFLLAMAEQAAVAVDYATLLQRERAGARSEERQRLARDLHDSIVQQVFSISMQAKSLSTLGQRSPAMPAEQVHTSASEISTLAQAALADLRALIHELQPSSAAHLGLAAAVQTLVDSLRHRTHLQFHVRLTPGLDTLPAELAEDLYRIVAEAIHNVVKHAHARTVTIRMELAEHTLSASVADDGHGLPQHTTRSRSADGSGLAMMDQRAQRWGGTVSAAPHAPGGTTVHVWIPLSWTEA